MLMVRLRLRTKQEAADSIPSVLASLLTWLVENRARLFLAVLGRRSASLVWWFGRAGCGLTAPYYYGPDSSFGSHLPVMV
jgi:hypothetical protein